MKLKTLRLATLITIKFIEVSEVKIQNNKSRMGYNNEFNEFIEFFTDSLIIGKEFPFVLIRLIRC